MDNEEILIPNFFMFSNFKGHEDDHALRKSDLSWTDREKRDARSDDPETIFRFHVDEAGFNIVFYWLEDGNFYNIETEAFPIQVRKLEIDPDWDGKYINTSYQRYTKEIKAESVIYQTEDVTTIWDELTINGKHLSEILPNAVILEID